MAGSAAIAVAALASSGVAQADRYVAPGRVVVEAPSTWSGLYFGLQAGYSFSDIDVSAETFAGAPFPAAGPWSVDPGRAIFGGQLGYQHQFGLIVLGVEGSLLSTFRDDGDHVACPGVGWAVAGSQCHNRVDDILSVGGRVGWAAGKWMPYFTGGYATSGYRLAITNPPNGAPGGIAGNGRNTGYYLGGGIDWMVAKDWILGLEYRHYEFDEDRQFLFTGGGAIGGGNAVTDPTVDTIALRVSWKFHRERDVVPLK
jgi:outer membrane immunogenic protein